VFVGPKGMKVSDALWKSLGLFSVGWKSFVTIALVASLVSGFAEFLSEAELGSWASVFAALIDVAVFALAAGATVGVAGQLLKGCRPCLSRASAFSAENFRRTLTVAALITFLALAGFVVLIVPGFIFGAGTFVAVPVLLLERSSARVALKRSWALTRGRKWQVFGLSFVICALAVIPELLFTLLLGAASVAAAEGILRGVVAMAEELVDAVGLVLAICIQVVVYIQLRFAKEGS